MFAVSWPLNILDVRARAPFASVASAFDAPPGHPGYGWSRDGHGPVDSAELATFGGPDHCHWQSATMMFIGWPIGTNATTFAQARYYLRDPQGVIGVDFRDRLVRNATLPTDAAPTGYRLGPIQIFLSPGDQDEAIYVVSPSGAERWPRVVEANRGLCL
ncbi:MAG: hypothetical protein M3P16_11010 [Chloroflexota bacterium]|nr:hypothetical protein [Chloroflexota bacterium]